MYKFIINIFLFIVILLDSISFANDTQVISPDLQKFIFDLEKAKSQFQGGAIAILEDGNVIYKTTFGKLKGKDGDITEKTLFPLASISKPVFATAITLLIEQNKMSLEEMFTFPYFKNSLNLVDMLSHSTGYMFSGNFEIEQGLTKEEILNNLKKQIPKCTPGKCFKYSNVMFSVIEESLNQKNLTTLEAFINLQNTIKTKEIQILPLDQTFEVAYPHSGVNLEPYPFPPFYPKTVPSAAGVFASIDGMIEMFKLSFGYMPEQISQKTLDQMQSPIMKTPDLLGWEIKWPINKNIIDPYYGLGWRILKIKGNDNIGKDLIFHSGHIKGINTFMGYIPSKKIGIIILLNQDSYFPIEKGFSLWSLLVDIKTVNIPNKSKKTKISNKKKTK